MCKSGLRGPPAVRTEVRRQHGISAVGAMVLVLFAWSGEIMVMRSYPMYMEYMAIRGTLSSLAVNAERTGVNSREIRRQFDVEAREKGIQALRGVDLEISSGDGSVSIGIEYSRIVPVAGNVGLQFDFVVRSQG